MGSEVYQGAGKSAGQGGYGEDEAEAHERKVAGIAR